MSVSLYLDHNVPAQVMAGLRRRGVDILTAADDGRAAARDPILLQRATELGRVIFTHDADFLRLSAEWQQQQTSFAGVIWTHQESMTIGALIDELAFFATAAEPSDCANLVRFLPL